MQTTSLYHLLWILFEFEYVRLSNFATCHTLLSSDNFDCERYYGIFRISIFHELYIIRLKSKDKIYGAKWPFVVVLIVLNTLRPKQNGRHFADDIFSCIFLNENVLIPIKFSLKFVPKGPINNIPALVQIMAWRRDGAKPLSEPMIVSLPTHICVTRPQWVNLYQSQIFIHKISNWQCYATSNG